MCGCRDSVGAGCACAATLIWDVSSQQLASGAQMSSSVIDLYIKHAQPSMAGVAATVPALGPYVWGLVEFDTPNPERMFISLNQTAQQPAPVGVGRRDHFLNPWAPVHGAGGAVNTSAVPFGPVLVSGRFLQMIIGNGGTVATTVRVQVWSGSLAQAAVQIGRAYWAGADSTGVASWSHSTAIANLAIVRSPLFLVDPGVLLLPRIGTLAALTAGLRAFNAEGHHADFLVDILGSAAGGTLTVRLRVGAEAQNPLPTIHSAWNLAVAGVTLVTSDQLMRASTSVDFPPRIPMPWCQLELEAGAVGPTKVLAGFRVSRE